MKSWRNRFSVCRVAQARRKAIRIFNGRLRALLLVFQRRRKQLHRRGRQCFSRTFPIKKNKRQDQGKKRRGDNGRDEQPKGARIATGFGSGAPSHGSKPPLGERMRRWFPVSPGSRRRRRDRAALNPRARPIRRKTDRITRRFGSSQRQAAANLQQPSAAGANPKARKSAGKEWARRLRESQEGNQMEKKKEERRKSMRGGARGKGVGRKKVADPRCEPATEIWCRKVDSNYRPTDYESVALPTELFRQAFGEDIPIGNALRPKLNLRIIATSREKERILAKFWRFSRPIPIRPHNRQTEPAALQIALGTINPPKLDLGGFRRQTQSERNARKPLWRRGRPRPNNHPKARSGSERNLCAPPPPRGGPRRAFARPCGPTARGVKSLNRCFQAQAQSAMRAGTPNRDGSAVRAETDSKARPLGRSRPSSQIEPTEALPNVWLRLGKSPK